ncbi:MAG: S-methyl-5'-thioadenosine phosphorylase [Myxococcota bacterium]
MTEYPQTPATGDDRVPIGLIGGSGLYDIEGFEVLEEREIDTPFGSPSAPVTIGEFEGRRVAFLPRHGASHQFNPSAVPYRANIWALKSLGVFWLVTVSAVGSLREQIVPGESFVVPDQVIDKTYKRANTFFEDIAVHVGLSYPYHPMLREVLVDACRAEGIDTHDGGTYVCMEGPAFSTKAESEMHRQWGADLIGMTAMPEAKLAREAEICYAGIALPTDYDVWYDEDYVDVGSVMENMRRNVANVQKVLKRAIPRIPLDEQSECDANDALEFAIVTKPDAITESTRRRLGLLIGTYLEQ